MANQSIPSVEGKLYVIKHQFAARPGAFLRYDVFILSDSQHIEAATNAIKESNNPGVYAATSLKQHKKGAIFFENHEELDLSKLQSDSIQFRVNEISTQVFQKKDHFDFFADLFNLIDDKLVAAGLETAWKKEGEKLFYHDLLGIPIEILDVEEESSVEDLEEDLACMDIDQKKDDK